MKDSTFIAAMLLAALSLTQAATAVPEEITARWKKLGALQELTPPEKNPALELLALAKDFPPEARAEFRRHAGDERPAHKIVLSDAALEQCEEAVSAALKIIAKGPGRLPPAAPDDLGASEFMFLQRASLALAARSATDGKRAETLAHLSFGVRVGDYLAQSDATLMAWTIANMMKNQSYDALFEVYVESGDPKILDHIATLLRKYPFKTEAFLACMRSEATFTYNLYLEFPKFLRKWNADFETPWSFISREPLKSCTLDQLLDLEFSIEASLAKAVDDFEKSLAWAKSERPLIEYPGMKNQPEPRSLEEYQRSLNGLYEIFDECGEPQFNGTLVAAQLNQTFNKTALAWLRAEADGVRVISLETLVPKYLNKLPVDPYDGNPLRCLPAQRKLYAVGVDLVDDDGADLSGFEFDEDFDLSKLPKTSDITHLIPKLGEPE